MNKIIKSLNIPYILFAVQMENKNFLIPRRWYYHANCYLIDGIWRSKDIAEKDAKNIFIDKEFDIVEIELTNIIHSDFIRLFNMPNMDDYQKKDMLIGKLRQFLRTQILQKSKRV